MDLLLLTGPGENQLQTDRLRSATHPCVLQREPLRTKRERFVVPARSGGKFWGRKGRSGEAFRAGEKARCKPLLEKRIVHGLFVLPFNGLSAEERKDVEQAGSIRVRDVMRAGDIGITFLGFLLSVVSRTRVYEKCDDAGQLARKSGDETLKRLRDENERLREENWELRNRLKEKVDSQEREPTNPPAAEKSEEKSTKAP